MINLRNIKIRNRLIIGFVMVIGLSIALGLLAFREMNHMWEGTKGIYEHPFAVSNAVREIKIGIITIHRDVKDVVLTEEGDALSDLIQRIDDTERKVYENFEVVYEQYLGEKNDIDESYNALKNWKAIRDKVIQLRLENKYDEAAEITKGEGHKHIEELQNKVQKLLDFAENKAQSYYNTANDDYRSSISKFLILIISISGIGLLSSILITRSIISPLEILLAGVENVKRGNLDYSTETSSKDEIGEFSRNFAEMTQNLKITLEDTEKKINYLNNIPTPVHVVDKELNVIFINKAGADFVKKQINQCIGKKCYNLFNTNHCRTKNCCSEKAMNLNGKFSAETVCNPSNNNDVPIRYMSAPIKENNGNIIGAIEYILDITDEAQIINMAEEISKGNYNVKIEKRNQDDRLASVLNSMSEDLKKLVTANDKQDWIKTGQAELNIALRGEWDITEISNNVISYIAEYLNAQIGAIYIKFPNSEEYKLQGSYAYQFRKGLKNTYKKGEGLIGQAALEKKMISMTDVPDSYVRIDSSLGDSLPKNIIVLPLIIDKETIGIIELGSIKMFSGDYIEFLENVQENIAIGINTTINRSEMKNLLEKTRQQSEELQVQQEELRQTNEELEEQTKALKKSEEFLQAQQEELRVTNEELEERTKDLERQKSETEVKNTQLEKTRFEIEEKARQLEITSKYKSEFLANMSHELRTPLNSLLLLSQDLSENTNQNLTKDQIESAKIIHKSGNDLLNLINEILDLSKIESGKLQLSIAHVPVKDIVNNIELYFNHVVEQKGLGFNIDVLPEVPENIETDAQRLEQVIRNFVSNAIKFTENGEIKIKVRRPVDEEVKNLPYLSGQAIAISVADTGIGIPDNKLHEIFEAFQQIDGSISRRYDGTGLGLSISKELSKLLKGHIKVKSEVGQGSEFTVVIPVLYEEVPEQSSTPPTLINPLPQEIPKKDTPIIKEANNNGDKVIHVKSIPDDRDEITPDDKVVLIIEDDNNFAKGVYKLCKSKDFKCITSATGEEGIELAKKFKPQGIILDIKLPGIDGWTVLDKLKKNASTRHIPVHIMSANEETLDAYTKGAIGYFTKPITKEKLENAIDGLQKFINRKMKDLLLIEDNNEQRVAIKALIGTKDIRIDECKSGKDAFNMLKEHNYDCAILDLGLPDISGFDLLLSLEKASIKVPPIIVYTGRDLTREENNKLERYASSIIIKGVRSEERLLDETSLFLHRVIDEMPTRQQKMLTNLYNKDVMFKDKKILVVDDDMRNVFALTQLLEKSQMKVIMANNGKKALESLETNNDIDLVLMDIMMPIMDGYKAMEKIRSNPENKDLPIIAITAKAMKEDRQKCIEAGANDYLSKPVDTDKLFNLMRVWLYQ